jgi:hypothetical protein
MNYELSILFNDIKLYSLQLKVFKGGSKNQKFVIPADAGIYFYQRVMDSSFRWNDG